MNNQTSSEKPKHWFVYIVLTDQDSLYTGITTNIKRRFQEHLDTAQGKHKAKGAKFFRSATPTKVVHQETFENRSQASRREAEIKAMRNMEKKKLCQFI